jgi:hypothetical protein
MKRKEKALELHLEKLKSSYKTYQYEQRMTAKNVLAIIESSTMEYLKKIPHASQKERSELRTKIYQILKKPYTRIRSKGLYHVQIVLPNNQSFLRMHKPDKFGDDLSEIRHSFKYTNKTKKPTDGFEAGKTSHGYRYIFPIFDEAGNYLCSVETSFTSIHLQNYFTNVMDIHTHYLIHKNVFDAKEWKTDEKTLNYIESVENNNYMLIMKNHDIKDICTIDNKNLLNYKKYIKENMNKEKSFSFYIENESSHVKVISFEPIKSVNGKTLSWIVSYEKDSFIVDTIKNVNLLRIIVFTLLTFIFYFIFKSIIKCN